MIAKKKRKTVGLALGGGAARGLAHLGVLRVLEREQVPIDLISGTSMGSLVGALYAGNPRAEKLIAKAQKFYQSEEFAQSRIHGLKRNEEVQGFFDSFTQTVKRGLMIGSTVTRLGFLDREDLYSLLSNFIDDSDIRNLLIPLGIVVCDLLTGQEVVLRRGPIIDAVAASSAVPGAFPPIRIGEMECIDGGVVNMVPISVVREMGADVVIAVNVSHDLLKPPELKRALEIYFRTQDITKRLLIEKQLEAADVVITPQVGHIHWADFTAAETIIKLGEQAAEEALPRIRELFAEKPRRNPLRRLLGFRKTSA
ncbi:MAG TPA: patatin-like phospholipase family protein [bacterium]|nr:patatin-like phospholipase family protein [bacterium]